MVKAAEKAYYGLIPYNILFDTTLSPNDVRFYGAVVYGYNLHLLRRLRNVTSDSSLVRTKALGNLDKVFYESQATIAATFGISENSKNTHIGMVKRLKKAGWLKVIKVGDGKNSNYYVPLDGNGNRMINITNVDCNVLKMNNPKYKPVDKAKTKVQNTTETYKEPSIFEQDVDDDDDNFPF